MKDVAPTPNAEWRNHGPLVLAATLGYAFHMLATYSTGLFIEPLGEEFGWNRTQVAMGLTLGGFLSIPMSPVIGAAVDRWGSRRIAIIGSICFALAFSAFGLANGSTTQWLALWSMFAVAALLVQSTVWTAAVSRAFTRSRGLALGLTICGGALAQIAVPPMTYWLIEHFGWRVAYASMGLGWGAVVLVLTVLFLFDAHDGQRQDVHSASDSAASAVPLPGLTVAQALRSIPLWRIAAASVLTMSFGMAAIVHQVPILVEAGVTRANAALLASLSGVAGIAGKIVTGYLMDRRKAGLIGGLTLAVSAIGFLLLLETFRTPPFIVVAMMIIGYSTGAKLQISAYLVGRYGGIRNFGKIFGVVVALIGLSSASSAVVGGMVYDAYGSYSPLLIVGIPGSIVSGLLIIGLGAYPRWESPEESTADRAAKPEAGGLAIAD